MAGVPSDDKPLLKTTGVLVQKRRAAHNLYVRPFLVLALVPVPVLVALVPAVLVPAVLVPVLVALVPAVLVPVLVALVQISSVFGVAFLERDEPLPCGRLFAAPFHLDGVHAMLFLVHGAALMTVTTGREPPIDLPAVGRQGELEIQVVVRALLGDGHHDHVLH